MRKQKIFLSYRRKDIPGYVRMLEQQLESEFGDGRVFRDTSDIAGGAQWRETIETNLRDSAVLLLIIGPHWERIWGERAAGDENYVAYELQLARKHDVKVIPVTVDGVQISPACDLGELDWIRGPQAYDLSDRQNRWSTDFRGLVQLLEQVDGIGPARGREGTAPPAATSRYKWIAAGAAAALALVWWSASDRDVAMSLGDIEHYDTPFAAADDNGGDVMAAGAPPVNAAPPAAAAAAPTYSAAPQTVDITGTWQGQDGTIYLIEQSPDGSIEVHSPGYTSGRGMPLPGVPGSYTIQMAGVGAGQFAVAADGYSIIGWLDTVEGRISDRLARID